MTAARLPADVVVPTTGRPSLRALLDGLAGQDGPLPGRVVLVDDRPGTTGDGLGGVVPGALRPRTLVLRSGGRGPAAARNAGWRAARAPWVAFLDDDVLVPADWTRRLASDLRALPAAVAGSQGAITVPRPAGRRPTDWERNVIGLESATWATADLAYRRSALAAAGGFDERFPRAYREDADLGLRLTGRGLAHRPRPQARSCTPSPRRGARSACASRPATATTRSCTACTARGWRERARAPRGRIARHAAVDRGRRRRGRRRRHRPHTGRTGGRPAVAGRHRRAGPRARSPADPRDRREIATMLATSAAAARRRGRRAPARRARPRRCGPAGRAGRATALPDAVLLDRDGTLVVDVPYNGDPGRVVPMPGARAGLDRLRAAGVPLGVVSNQSGIARGLLTIAARGRGQRPGAGAARTARRLGRVPARAGRAAAPAASRRPGSCCRRPRALGVEPQRCVVVGDIGADVQAAHAAGARAILVPTPATRPEEVAAAPELAPDLGAAVDLLLGGAPA